VEVFTDIMQGTDAWRRVRMGIPTASEFAAVCAKPGPRGGTSHKEMVGRTSYMHKLAGEILTGEPMESYENDNMLRGKEREQEARDLYSLLHDVEPQQVGFIRNGNCGCSPDSLVGDAGGLEIKDALPHVQIARLKHGALPSEHRLQVYGELMVSGREWFDFMSHCRNLPPLIIRVPRDEAVIAEIRDAVDKFVAELDQLVKWIRAMQ
jgi:hypothetical protein